MTFVAHPRTSPRWAYIRETEFSVMTGKNMRTICAIERRPRCIVCKNNLHCIRRAQQNTHANGINNYTVLLLPRNVEHSMQFLFHSFSIHCASSRGRRTNARSYRSTKSSYAYAVHTSRSKRCACDSMPLPMAPEWNALQFSNLLSM